MHKEWQNHPNITLSCLIIVLLIFVSAGCTPATSKPVNTPSQPTPTSSVFLTPSETVAATPILRTISLPTESVSRVITPQSAAEVAQLARLGQGMVNGAPFYSMDGELLVIPTTIGIDFYEASSLRKLRSVSQLTDGGVTLMPIYPRLVALSPEGRFLAENLNAYIFAPNGELQEQSMQQFIYVWDITAGSVLWKRQVGWETVLADLAFSPDGQKLAVGFGAGNVQLWEAASGEDLFSFKGSELEFSPDGRLLATMPSGSGGDQFIHIYSLADGQRLGQWEGQRAVFSSQGLLAIERDGAVRLVDLDKKIALFAFNGKSVAFSVDGQSLALLDRGMIRLYRVADGSLIRTLEDNFEAISNMQFSPDGHTLAVEGDVPMCPNCLAMPQAALWHISDGTRMKLEIQEPLGLTYAPHEGHLVVWAIESIQFLSPQNASTIAVLEEYAPMVDGDAFSPDGQTVAANSGNPHLSARLWRVGNGQLEKLIEDPNNPGYGSAKVLFSPDGQILWMQGSFWHVKDGERLTQLENKLREEAPNYIPASVAFSLDGKTMAIGYLEGYLQLWDLGEEKLIRKLDGYQGEVVDLAFSSDGMTLAAVYDYPDYTIQLWKVPQGERSLSIKGTEWEQEFSQVVFSPDGQILATLSKNNGTASGDVELWRASDGERMYQLEVKDAMSLALSKDGEVIATGSNDHTVRLWKTSDGSLLKILSGHGDYVTDLAFSPSGELLASSSNDGTVILWGVHIIK
jgi:WD40 repeat protein